MGILTFEILSHPLNAAVPIMGQLSKVTSASPQVLKHSAPNEVTEDGMVILVSLLQK